MQTNFIMEGDSLDVLQDLPPETYDSLITDPPAGISFMGKKWDGDKGGRKQWITWMTEVMKECHRVMKPGAHGFVWALPRTSHWTATALEDAGFDIRDVVTHLFGSGFPKSHNVSKAIDKMAGTLKTEKTLSKPGFKTAAENYKGNKKWSGEKSLGPQCAEAKQWDGWGTALKPASEHWILIRKPFNGTVAKNVLEHGTGAINIDGSRVEAGADLKPVFSGAKGKKQEDYGSGTTYGDSDKYESVVSPQGRFPANLILSHSEHCTDDQCDIECAIEMLDAQSGVSKSTGGGMKRQKQNDKTYGKYGLAEQVKNCGKGDSGGASRFFYCAKPSKRERNEGLEGMEEKDAGIGDSRPSGQSMQRLDGRDPSVAQNFHPTVKAKKLMSYLINMITPPGGQVLDPFTGSGSTGVACAELGFNFTGIEKEPEYVEIARGRINHVVTSTKGENNATTRGKQNGSKMQLR